MDIFCPKHTNCEAPISVIADILSNDCSLSSEEIEIQFKILNFNKVKDLASSTLGKACQMPLGDDPLKKLYRAIEIYDKQCAAEQLDNALSEYQQGNFTNTQEICNKMFLNQPDNLTVCLLLAGSYFNCEEFDKSIEILKSFKQLPNTCEVLMNIGTNYWKKSQLSEVVKYYHEALCLKPGFFNGWIHYAVALYESNAKLKATIACKLILRQCPDLHSVRNMYGRMLLDSGRVKEAKQQFKIAKDDAPEFLNSWYDLGDVYYNASKFVKAVQHYEKALQINPKLIPTWINLGLAYNKLKEHRKAFHTFQNVLKSYPNCVAALKNVAIYQIIRHKYTSAAETFKKWLEYYPDNLDAHYIFGVLLIKLGEKEEAETHFKKCIEQLEQLKLSHQENVYSSLNYIYASQGKIKCVSKNFIAIGDLYFNRKDYIKSIEAYNSATYCDPENADSYWKLGISFHYIGEFNDAFMCYRKSIELRPNFPNVYCDCALIYETKNQLHKAVEYYEMALVLQPGHLATLHNISNLQLKLENYNEATKWYKEILKYDDTEEELDVHMKLADIYYKKLENYNEALFHCEQCLQIDNTFVNSYLCMGNIYLEMKKTQEALNSFNLAVQVDPQCVIAYTNIGSIHKDKENFNDAIQAYKTALSIQPDFPDAYCNLVQCMQQICDWSDYDLRTAKLKEIVCKQLNNNAVPSLLPHHSLLYPFSPRVLKEIATKHSEQHLQKPNIIKKISQGYKYQTTLSSNGRIRVGYVSSDFGDHPTSQLMQSIPKFHNRKTIEVFCYSLTPNDNSPSWSKISSESDHLRDISNMNAVDAANLINEDKIHILVNMNGFTKGARNEIFALRPAPIQVLWLGYPGTSGASYIDYIITDKICSPPEFKHFYTENLAYIKHSVFIGDHKQMFGDLQQLNIDVQIDNSNKNLGKILPINNGDVHMETDTHNGDNINELDDTLQYCTRQFYNLPEEAVVFCNFGQLYKIDPPTLKLWANILLAVPNSVLWLLRFPGAGEENLRKSATELNIDSSRIIFSDLEIKSKHMRRIQLADIFLDTPLCNGHTTCLDALWAGIPVVTKPGETLASRVAASLLNTLGISYTIVQSNKDYVDIAIKLANSKVFLNSTKLSIWSLKTSSKLFDCKSYAEELETVYKDLWKEKYL